MLFCELRSIWLVVYLFVRCDVFCLVLLVVACLPRIVAFAFVVFVFLLVACVLDEHPIVLHVGCVQRLMQMDMVCSFIF